MAKKLNTAKFEALLHAKGREVACLEGGDATLGAERPYVQGAPTDASTVSLSEVNMKILREIDYALERIREGDYGVCEDCGEAIPEARLVAIPWARQCLACEQLLEESA